MNISTKKKVVGLSKNEYICNLVYLQHNAIVFSFFSNIEGLGSQYVIEI